MSTFEPPARPRKPGGFALWLARINMKHGAQAGYRYAVRVADFAVPAAIPDCF